VKVSDLAIFDPDDYRKISCSHWGMFPDDPFDGVVMLLDNYASDDSTSLDCGLVESFDGEFIPDPDRECGLSAQGAASERQLRHSSQCAGRDVTWQKLNFGPHLP
jgi:hypothetical protein